ncbi:MAG: hypothetical protein AAF614_26710 [Chloroflexota bacterium]
MAISKKNRKALSRRKIKQKKRVQRSKAFTAGLNVGGMVRKSGSWPLVECLIPVEWQETEQIQQICIVRQSPATGMVAAGVYLVDLACLGVKNAYAAPFHSVREYQEKLRTKLAEGQEMMEADINLAAKIIDESIVYAKSLGLKPHKDIRQANWVRGETHPEMCDEDIPVGGSDGKPLFVQGPYDNVDKIMRILDRTVGRENYHYLLAVGDPFNTDMEMYDEDFDEFDED